MIMAAKRTSTGRKTGKSTASRKTAAKSTKKKATRKAPAKKRTAAKKKPAKRAKKKASRRSSAPESPGRRASRAVTGSMARSSAKGRGRKPVAREGPRPQAASSRGSARRGGGAEVRDAGKPGTRIPHIDDATLDKIEAKLTEMRAESANIVNRKVSTDSGGFSEDTEVGDDMDLASQDRDREFNLLMHERHLRRIQQIDEAFQRIKDRSYGLCEGTDEPINPRRLLIYPLARYSIEYQQEQEKMLGRTPDEFFFEEEANLENEEE
jgi:DnaK suppressor protein